MNHWNKLGVKSTKPQGCSFLLILKRYLHIQWWFYSYVLQISNLHFKKFVVFVVWHPVFYQTLTSFSCRILIPH